MSDVLARLQAAVTDRYLIEREIGEGGMATVYLARDLKHGRPVALKVLRPELSAILGSERFLKEIELTAHLRHPHILPLHDSGAADGLLYYVMPFVSGESLRQKLTRERQLSVAEAVGITGQVATALEYAHGQGLVHRDIKPENILLEAGQAVVSDFGIALAVRSAGGARLTETGLSLGTPQYMSPEQAAGDRELDARSDVYSLGCVTYEMLAGDPPHTASTVQAVIAKVLTDTPKSLSALRRSVPAHVSAAVDQALEKLPADRFARARDFCEALEGRAFVGPTAASQPAIAPHLSRSWMSAATRAPGPTLLAMALVAMILVAGAFVAGLKWHRPVLSSSLKHLALTLPPAVELMAQDKNGLALSPDGTHLIFPGRESGVIRLYDRRMDRDDAVPIPGTEGGHKPFFSPDGRWVGFMAGGKLKKVSLTEGTAVAICDISDLQGATWGANDTIVFASVSLFQVSANGGPPRMVAIPDTAKNEQAYSQPALLPDGQNVLFTIWTGGFAHPRIAVLSLKTGRQTILPVDGIEPRFAPPGHLVFVRGGALWAAPFDVTALTVTAPALPVVQGVHMEWAVWPYFAVGGDGTLAYVPGAPLDAKQLVWVDRKTREIHPLSIAAKSFDNPVLSPDVKRLAIVVRGDNPDVWTYDLARGSAARVTTDPGEDETPVWMPDGKRLVFAGNRSGQSTLLRAAADGSGAEEKLLGVPGTHLHATSLSRDSVLAFQYATATGGDIWVMPLVADRAARSARPFLNAPFEETGATFSPDGKWIAYTSNESGRNEVYLVRYPGGDQKSTISTAGGTEPVWSQNGQELFYRNGDRMMVAAITVTPTAKVGPSRVVFEGRFDALPWNADYDVAADGQRFLMVRSADTATNPNQLNIILNWFDELKRRVPARRSAAK